MIPIKVFNNPKVSVIVTFQDVVNDYYEKCLDSLINQKLDSIEIICIKNEENINLNILEKYLSRYDLIKTFTKDYFQNNFKSIINSDYVFFLNPNDWTLVVGLENAYNIAIENNLDILINSYNNFYEHSGDIDDPYQDEYSKLNKLIDFSDSDFKNIIFNMPKYPFNLYKTDFIKKNNLKVPFGISQQICFFLESSARTSNIGYNNKPLLYNNIENKSDYYNLICNDFNQKINDEFILNIDEIVEHNITLLTNFKDNNIYNNNKYYLLNYIFKIFKNISFMEFKNNEEIFNKIHDAVSNFFSKYHEDLILNLNIDYLTFYRAIFTSESMKELELTQKYKNMLMKNEEQEITISKLKKLSDVSKQLKESDAKLSKLTKENSENTEKLNEALIKIKNLEQDNERLDSKYLEILMKNVKLNNEYNQLVQTHDKSNKVKAWYINENKRLMKEMDDLKNSRSWKIAKYFEKIGYNKAKLLIGFTFALILLLIISIIVLSMLILRLV